jgi:small-conductance mechanosensitive channel
MEDAASIVRQWDQIPLLWIALYVAIAWLAIELVKRGIPRLAAQLPDRSRFYILPWAPLLRMVILVVAVAEIFPLVIDTSGDQLLALFAASAVALGFAFKDYISSLIAGIVVLYERPYRVGDWVTMDNSYGEVKAINFRTWEFLTADDDLVIVPHLKMWDTKLLNSNSGQRELQCSALFFVHPNHDGGQVRQLLYDVAYSSCYTSLRHPIAVLATEQPWGTQYRIRAYPVECRDQFAFETDLTLRGKAMLLAAGCRLTTATPVAPPLAEPV